jgi:hypothetical protein
MNPILQISLIVVVGTVIVASGLMGALLLGIRLQRGKATQPDIDASERPSPQSGNAVVFEVAGKQVAIHIDVQDAPVSGLRVQRL